MDARASRSTPLLPSAASSHPSFENNKMMDPRRMLSHKPSLSQSALSSAAALSPMRGASLSRPRPEIILRWKRFALLVVLGAVLISAVTVTLYIGIPLTRVRPEDAEKRVANFNSYSGVFMGFIESGVSQLLGYLFPVFIVYLHNLKWSRLDDPATRPISKMKKTALLLFFPLVMIAIGNSLSAVQTNQSGGTDDEPTGLPSRRLTMDEFTTELSALDETLFKSVGGRTNVNVDGVGDWQRVASGTRVKVGFPLHDWRNELEPQNQESKTEGVSTETAVELLRHGLTMFQQLAKDQHVDLSLKIQQLNSFAASATPQNVRDAVVRILGSSSGSHFNTSGMTMDLSLQQLQPAIQLQSLTLALPLTTTPSSVSCGKTACIVQSTDPLVRMRPLVAVSGSSSTNAAFFYSSSVSSKAPDGYTLMLTFAKLMWSFESSAFDLCPDSAVQTPVCKGLTLSLPRSRRHLVLTAQLVPHTSPLQTQRLVELVQPPMITPQNQLAGVTLMEGDLQPSTDPTVDLLAAFLRANRLAGDRHTMAATLPTTALLFLFQNAIVTPSATTAHVAWQRHLSAQATTNGTTKDYEIFVANTRFGAMSTWTACGILFVLTTLVLVLPNARARLEPPKGGNARAERFVSVQTEEVYPNLVYKKRFRIGKTGEKIKFREFAVEAVTLHHKMEEDEQIEL